MKKLSMVAISVAAALTSQAYASEVGQFDVSVYGKVGATTQTNQDTAGVPTLDTRTDEDFDGYQDSKLGVKIGYGINSQLSVQSEIKGDFEGKEEQSRIQELYLQAQSGAYELQVGRMTTPVYMDSQSVSDDFALHSYRGVRGFSVEDTALESIDGVSISLDTNVGGHETVLRAYTGETDGRIQGSFDESKGETTTTTTDAKNVWGLEAKMATQYGHFRASHIEAEVDEVTFRNTSLDYSVTHGMTFVDASVSKEDSKNVEYKKGFVTVGAEFGKLTPSVTYSRIDADSDSVEDTETVELGLAYQVSTDFKLKTAYEHVDYETSKSAEVFSLGAAFRF